MGMRWQGLALAAADEKDDVAKDIGAANTMVWRPQGGYKALNTDWVGVKIAIEKSLGSGDGGLAKPVCAAQRLACFAWRNRHRLPGSWVCFSPNVDGLPALQSSSLRKWLWLSAMAAPVQQTVPPFRLLGRRRWWWALEAPARPSPTTQPRLVLRWVDVGASCLLSQLSTVSTPWVAPLRASRRTAGLMLCAAYASGAGLRYAGRQGSAGGRQPGQRHIRRVYGRCQCRRAGLLLPLKLRYCNFIGCSTCFCCDCLGMHCPGVPAYPHSQEDWR